MKTVTKCAINIFSRGTVAALAAFVICGCSSVVTKTELLEVEAIDESAQSSSSSGISQGTAVAVWEEPMVDVVDVPPGLDPEGHYYRPAHQEIVEIRQGRWQYYRKAPNR
ncbi:MAG: hypothetical protein J5J00_16655 [Deltaproteobacteria bacterium]|nr:hypothetical protein [Deltaproteobacteria bacterium]